VGLAAFTHGLPVILFPDRFEFDVNAFCKTNKFKPIFGLRRILRNLNTKNESWTDRVQILLDVFDCFFGVLRG
jgi:hypothetical protein